MSKHTESNLFIVSSLPRLYQQLLGGAFSYQQLGNRIIRQIEAAHAFRQIERVKEYSRLLINFPAKELQLIGQYYLAWCEARESKPNPDILVSIIEETTTYKTKAMFSLAAFEGYQGRIETSLRYYIEALKTSPSISEYIDLSRSIAVLKAAEGFHKTALRDLEGLIPMLKQAEPRLYYDFLNSYAIELGEAGRVYEARNACNLVLASPFAFAYPEWLETAKELRPANRSFAVIKPSKIRRAKLLRMPQINQIESTEADTLAPVISLADWKKKMGKDNDTDLENLDGKQLALRLMSTIAKENFTDDELLKMLKAAHQIVSERSKTDEEEE